MQVIKGRDSVEEIREWLLTHSPKENSPMWNVAVALRIVDKVKERLPTLFVEMLDCDTSVHVGLPETGIGAWILDSRDFYIVSEEKIEELCEFLEGKRA